MILQPECAGLDGIGKLKVILHEDIVVINGDDGGLGDLAIHDRGALDMDIVALP